MHQLFYLFILASSAAASANTSDDDLIYLPYERSADYWVNVHQEAPIYPQRALRRFEEGCSAVGFIIEADGTTMSVRTAMQFINRFLGIKNGGNWVGWGFHNYFLSCL